MRNISSTALPGWYVEFQAALLRQAPRPGESPGEIDQVTAEGWIDNQKSLKNKLADCLVPPWAKTAGKFLPEEGKGTLMISEVDEEKLLEGNRQFLDDTFIKWYSKTDAEKAHQSVKIVSPKDIDWSSLKDDIDKDKFGEYTMNPDTAGIDWESIPPEKIKVFNFSEFIGKPRLELAKHLTENYSDKYHIPGIEYWKYLIENEDKIPEELKDGNYYYFFGSILRGRYGRWVVPYSNFYGSQWYRHARWLEYGWDSNNRVLLLEK